MLTTCAALWTLGDVDPSDARVTWLELTGEDLGDLDQETWQALSCALLSHKSISGQKSRSWSSSWPCSWSRSGFRSWPNSNSRSRSWSSSNYRSESRSWSRAWYRPEFKSKSGARSMSKPWSWSKFGSW